MLVCKNRLCILVKHPILEISEPNSGKVFEIIAKNIIKIYLVLAS